jgi:hypothetical protein
MTKRHIHNLSYNDLQQDVVDILSKSGIVNSDCTWDKGSKLPFIGRDMSPEEVRKAVRDTIAVLHIEKNDVVIIGGVPDVAFYIAEYVPPRTPVLTIIGKKVDGSFRVVGFREIIRSGDRSMNAIHVVQH